MPLSVRAPIPAARLLTLTTTSRPNTTSVLLRRTRHSSLLASHLARAQRRVYLTLSSCASQASLFPSTTSLPSAASYSTWPGLASTPLASGTTRNPSSSSSNTLFNKHFNTRLDCTQKTIMATQTREHGSHSHGHGHDHAHDNTFLVSTNKNDAGVRITRIGLYVNLGMAIVKGVGGYAFNSKALTADAFHSLTDLGSDLVTLFCVSLALKPPSRAYPHGYGKFESLGSLGVSAILLVGGVLMGWAAVYSLAEQLVPGFGALMQHLGVGHGHSHAHDHADLGPSLNAAWLAGGSILIKEWLYQATNKVARERKSAVLAANAYHHRVDSLTAMVALLTIVGARFLPGADWLDPVGGLVISLMVIQAGTGNTRAALRELSDAGLDHDVEDKIRAAAQRALAATKDGAAVEVHGVQGRKAGQTYLVDIEVRVPQVWSVGHTRKVEETLREGVAGKVRGVKRVKVRFVPQGPEAAEFEDEYITVSPRSSPEPESEDEKAGKKGR